MLYQMVACRVDEARLVLGWAVPSELRWEESYVLCAAPPCPAPIR